MMKKSNKIRFGILTILIVMVFGYSCKKQDDFLNMKSVGSLSTISTISDVQNILNNESLFNYQSAPGLGETSTDDYYTTSDIWLSRFAQTDQNAYVWAKQIYPVGSDIRDWNLPYQEIYHANIVLDALPKIKASQIELDQVKGAALFYRAIAFYNLIQTFALPYDSATAASNLGIPLRLNSDLNIKSVRATEQQCYNQIINDLQTALQLLPSSSQYLTRPNKAAANALLARIYLAIGNYEDAFKYADATLKLKGTLFDYNSIIPGAYYQLANISQYPLPEEIYHSTLNSTPASFSTKAIVDSSLYALYEDNDLRKKSFFAVSSGAIRFVGSYEFKKLYDFDGLATDEIYLIRAESNARLGNISAALSDLNKLLVNRYKAGYFVPRTATNADDALKEIIIERRKELCFRGLRWTDLRRLNKDPRFAITLKRVINGSVYALPPNDSRYALPIPDNEISLSGIQQNQR